MAASRRTKIVLFTSAGLIAALLAIPFLVPVEAYLRRIELVAGARLGDPVVIRDAQVQLLPTPRVTVEGVQIGEPALVRIERLVALPDLSTLFDAPTTIRDLRVDGLTVAAAAIPRMQAWSKSDGGPPAVRLASLTATNVVVESLPVGRFEAHASFAESGRLGAAKARTLDGKLTLDVVPVDGKLDLRLAARAWQLPAGPPLLLDTLDLHAVATESDADIAKIGAQLYGGTVQGRATLDWRKGLVLKATARGERLDLGALLPIVAPGARLTGRLTTDARVTASAPTAAQLADAVRVEATFDVTNGVLHGVDLVSAAKSIVGAGAQGGETRFDQLSGVATADGRGYHVRQLVVTSGVLNATGSIDVSRRQELSGRIEAEVKAGISLLKMPLNIAGTVGNPSVTPSGAAAAGAAAGTVIGGPVGTSIGARVGAFIDKVFGGDKKK